MDWREIIGYTGSVLVAVSLMMGNIWRLRWINLSGALFFTTYGILVHAYPVAALNGFVVLINIYHLSRLIRQRDDYVLAELHQESVVRDKFLEFYRADIQRYYPGFDWQKLTQPRAYFVLRNLTPANLFVYEVQADGTVLVQLDYVIPRYRDLRNADFLFAALREPLRQQGGKVLVTRSGVKSHQRYLRVVGFQADANDPTLFRKPV